VLDIIVPNATGHSSVRLSLEGRDNISYYCKTNFIPPHAKDNVTVISKRKIQGMLPLVAQPFFEEIMFKVDMKNEQVVDDIQKIEILANLATLDKSYRYKKRFSYVDPTDTVRFDMTIVKASRKIGQTYETNKSFAESSVPISPLDYEIEIEVVKRSTKEKEKIAKALIKSCIEVYSILNNEEYVVPQSEKAQVLRAYIELVYSTSKSEKFKGKFDISRTLKNAMAKPKKYFAGPQPITLEQKNIIKEDLGVVSIQKDYTVTEKADGERMLLYVHTNGKAYLINNRLDIKYTGAVLNSIRSSLIDGELISKNSQASGALIYAMFDIYWDNGEDVRSLPLVAKGKLASRYNLMKSFVTKTKSSFSDRGIDIRAKEFLYGADIFEESKKILTKSKLGEFDYHIDGLIFTPMAYPVGGSFEKDTPELVATWNKVFKWKPPSENTIDFLVIMKPNNFTVDSGNKGVRYRVLDLYVGYNPVQWEPISAKSFLENTLNRTTQYIAKQFIPGDVLSELFAQCYVKVDSDADKILCNGDAQDEITNNSIVEFAYINDESLPYPLRWRPLRVRHDKTDMLLKYGLSGTANDYGTAVNIWTSIQYPVTIEHIMGDKHISKDELADTQVYYFRQTTRDKFASRPMMEFHNACIKNQMLLSKFAGKESLFDISCGKAGDLSKWLEHGFTKVLGVDISRDNIENPIDGAYARTIENYKWDRSKHTYAYVTLDSSIKFNKDYFETILNKDDQLVCKTLWGLSTNEALKQYKGMALDKFNVVSCQFSIHYFFESEEKLDNFLWNVDQHLKLGGYFIGTCLDGQEIKRKMKDVPMGGHIQGVKHGRVLWHLKKTYKNNKDVSFGDTVQVYMESIGHLIQEYLVNFDILKEKLAVYGIHELESDELEQLKLPESVGSFEKAFNMLQQNPDMVKPHIWETISNMSSEEKEYSFMNRWFVFKKQPKISKETTVVPAKKKIIKKKAT
jgi:hypothetical protein